MKPLNIPFANVPVTPCDSSCDIHSLVPPRTRALRSLKLGLTHLGKECLYKKLEGINKYLQNGFYFDLKWNQS